MVPKALFPLDLNNGLHLISSSTSISVGQFLVGDISHWPFHLALLGVDVKT